MTALRAAKSVPLPLHRLCEGGRFLNRIFRPFFSQELGSGDRMQPQTTIATRAAKKSPSCINWGIVVSSIA